MEKLEHDSQRLSGAAALLGAAFLYASFGVLIRTMSTMYSDHAQVAIRFSLAFLLLTLLVFARKQFRRIPRETFIRILALGITFTLIVSLFTISVNSTKLANAVFLQYAGSIVSAFLIGSFWLKEKITTAKIVAITLALDGLFMYSNATFTFSLGILTGLAAGLLDGVANSLRKSLSGLHRPLVLFYQYSIGATFATLVMFIAGGTIIKTIALIPILTTILFAFLLVGLGQLLLYGFQHFDVNVGTVILAMELFFAIGFGHFLYDELPSTHELIGGTLIFAASLLSTVQSQRLARKSAASPTLPTHEAA